MLEDHRDEIKNKLRGDYLQYMTERAKAADKVSYRRNSYAGASPARTNAWLQETPQRVFDTCDLAHSTNRLTKVSTSFIKELNDSCYLRPDQNRFVI